MHRRIKKRLKRTSKGRCWTHLLELSWQPVPSSRSCDRERRRQAYDESVEQRSHCCPLNVVSPSTGRQRRLSAQQKCTTIHFAAKLSDQVNRKCLTRNTVLQLSTPWSFKRHCACEPQTIWQIDSKRMVNKWTVSGKAMVSKLPTAIRDNTLQPYHTSYAVWLAFSAGTLVLLFLSLDVILCK